MEVTYFEHCYQSDGDVVRDEVVVVHPVDIRHFKTYGGWRKHYNRLVANERQPVDFTVTDATGAIVARLRRTTDLEVLMKFVFEEGA
jgi:hypothetical protein